MVSITLTAPWKSVCRDMKIRVQYTIKTLKHVNFTLFLKQIFTSGIAMAVWNYRPHTVGKSLKQHVDYQQIWPLISALQGWYCWYCFPKEQHQKTNKYLFSNFIASSWAPSNSNKRVSCSSCSIRAGLMQWMCKIRFIQYHYHFSHYSFYLFILFIFFTHVTAPH